MARKIPHRLTKCKATGEQGYMDEFYRSETEGYFKSEEIYKEYRAEVDAYNKVKAIIDEDFLGYDPSLEYSSLTPYNLKKLQGYSYSVILETVKRYYENIIYAISNKEFKDSNAKCKYIFAIIKSHAYEVKKEFDAKKKIQQYTREKISKDTLQETLTVKALNSETNISQNQKNTDISKFLSEEELL